MQTMTLHARLIDLADRDGTVVPDHWRHDLDAGSLTYHFADSANTFTWDAAAVAAAPASADAAPSSPRAVELLERWEAITAMLQHGERRLPDHVLVDHHKDEMTLLWDDERVILVVDDAS